MIPRLSSNEKKRQRPNILLGSEGHRQSPSPDAPQHPRPHLRRRFPRCSSSCSPITSASPSAAAPPGSFSAMGDYTIQISTKLIDQLARDDEKVKRKTRKPKPRKVVPQHEDNAKEFPSEPKGSPAPGWPQQPPMYLPVTPGPPPPPAAIPEVEAIRAVLVESQEIERKVERQKAGMLQELNKRAKELHDKEFKLPYQNPALCTGEREDCLRCYKSSAQDPLKCAEAVKRFEACVRLARQSSNA